MNLEYRPRRRPLLERLGLRPDLNDRLATRLGPADGDGLDVQDAVLRQDMEWIEVSVVGSQSPSDSFNGFVRSASAY